MSYRSWWRLLACVTVLAAAAAMQPATAAASAAGGQSPGVRTVFKSYAGYSAAPLTGASRYAIAHWRVPGVDCADGPGPDYSGRAAVWVGLWGAAGSSRTWLMQAGTDSQCSAQGTSYHGWFELFPLVDHVVMTVRPGDDMYVQVEYTGQYEGRLQFRYDIADETSGAEQQGYAFTSAGVPLTGAAYQGGAIVEGSVLAGSVGHLPRFSPITVSGLAIGALSGRSRYTRYIMGASAADVLARPGPLLSSAFTINWESYST